MPPNIIDLPLGPDTDVAYNEAGFEKTALPPKVESTDENYKLNIFQSTLNLIAHIGIGITVAATLFYALRNGLPIGATPQHAIICTLGYQLLMAEGILSLCPHNGWSSRLRLVDRRRAHWILQLLGSGLALAGCFLKILDKNVHWNSLHGQFALVSMVFTTVSLVNGLTSLYAYELSKLYLPPTLSKLTHICFGIVAFAAASISLCYGFDKNAFRNFAGESLTLATIIITAGFTAIIIINPFITFLSKGRAVFKKN